MYDPFLEEYPLCYGYWKRYADAEAKYGSADVAETVYERAVTAVPYSVDIWAHYASFKQGRLGAATEAVRRCVPPPKLNFRL